MTIISRTRHAEKVKGNNRPTSTMRNNGWLVNVCWNIFWGGETWFEFDLMHRDIQFRAGFTTFPCLQLGERQFGVCSVLDWKTPDLSNINQCIRKRQGFYEIVFFYFGLIYLIYLCINTIGNRLSTTSFECCVMNYIIICNCEVQYQKIVSLISTKLHMCTFKGATFFFKS